MGLPWNCYWSCFAKKIVPIHQIHCPLCLHSETLLGLAEQFGHEGAVVVGTLHPSSDFVEDEAVLVVDSVEFSVAVDTAEVAG